MRNIRMQDRAEIQFTSKDWGWMSKQKCSKELLKTFVDIFK